VEYPCEKPYFFCESETQSGGRVIELVNGEHLDHLLGDTPDEMRPPSMVVFFDSSDSTCMRKFSKLQLQKNAEEVQRERTEEKTERKEKERAKRSKERKCLKVLPPRERLLVGKYDNFLASRRPWFKFTPERSQEREREREERREERKERDEHAEIWPLALACHRVHPWCFYLETVQGIPRGANVPTARLILLQSLYPGFTERERERERESAL